MSKPDERQASTTPQEPSVSSPYEAVIAATRDAVLAIDSRSQVTLFNPASERMFGYSRAEIMGRHISVLMAQPYATEHDEYIRRYERTGERKAIGRVRTVSGRRKCGEEFPIELSVAEYTTEGKRRYAAILRDISDKVRLQQERLEAEKLAAIGTTASKFAHELGNPINGMAVNAQLVSRWLKKSEPPVDPRVLDRLNLLMGGLDRLTELLDEFRTMSRRHQYRFAVTDLRVLLTELVETERAHYDQRGVRIETDVAADLGPVPADGAKLRQALLNLSKNAVEAMPDGGVLTLHAARTETGVAVEVQDTGIGIPEGIEVFAPFSSSKPQGSGLGLPIVRQIVEAHRGTLTYRSEPGVGTTFRLTLPS